MFPTIEIIGCYRASGVTLYQNEWNVIGQNITCDHTILVGDFNSHNILWNCDHTDSNGERLESMIDSLDLFLHNENSTTYVDMRRKYHSNLDLVLSTISLADKIEVQVSDDPLSSDHIPIYINISLGEYQYKKNCFKLYTLKYRWDDFTQFLKDSLIQFYENKYDQLSALEKYSFLLIL